MILTYELQEKNSAEKYYQISSLIAKEVQSQAEILEKYIDLLMDYEGSRNKENAGNRNEYVTELLYLAIIQRWIEHTKGNKNYDLSDMSYDRLLENSVWMEQSGEFTEELYRFQSWMGFFKSCEEDVWTDLWSKVKVLVNLVDDLGGRYLDKYLPYVNEYISKHADSWSNREDAGFIMRDKSCYYINMIGAKILNECYEEEFDSCSKVYIFLPGCMAKQMDKCMAREAADGYICNSCHKECQIKKLSEIYPNVRIIYHGSEIEKKKVKQSEKIGVVGVACVLNLLAGGFKARRLGYVPKCVILNECGCSVHWDKNGIVTSIDEEELKSIICSS